MVNQFFFEQTDQKILLNTKELLEQLKPNAEDTVPDNTIKILVDLLRTVASIANKHSSSPDNKVAAWLLLTDLYASLSYIYSLKSDQPQKNTEIALNQAFHCVDKVKGIIKSLASEYVLDIEFIKKCNTFAVADVETAMKYLATELVAPLRAKAEEQPLYHTSGAAM